MPELYSDQFLSTINVAVPSSNAASASAPASTLFEQIHTALGGEAYMLAALEAGYHLLRVKRGDEAGEKQPQTDIDRFLTSPHKANLPIALFFGTMKGNHVYVFLHRDTGTFPFALTYHAFRPSTGAHVSQYACDYMYVTSESRDSSFEFASDGSQTAALAWYYFSRFETLAHHHPRLPSKEILTVCKNAFHARWDATKETPNLESSSDIVHKNIGREDPDAMDIDEPVQPAEAPAWIHTPGNMRKTIAQAAAIPEQLKEIDEQIADFENSARQQLGIRQQMVRAIDQLCRQVTFSHNRETFCRDQKERLRREKASVIENCQPAQSGVESMGEGHLTFGNVTLAERKKPEGNERAGK